MKVVNFIATHVQSILPTDAKDVQPTASPLRQQQHQHRSCEALVIVVSDLLELHDLHVSTGSRAEEDSNTSNVFRLTQPSHWIIITQGLLATKVADETLGQLGGEEARRNDVAGNVLGAKLNRKVAGKMLMRSVQIFGNDLSALLTFAAAFEVEYMMVPCSPT